MKSRSFPFPLFQLSSAFILLILLSSPPASSASDKWFLNCTDFFDCKTISTIEFPLWRNEGTESCDPSETIKPNCLGNRATIEILGAEYELLGFSTHDQIFLIAQNYFSFYFCSQDISSFIYGIIPLSDYCGQPDKANCSESGSRLSYLPLENKTANGDPYCKVSTVVYISPESLKEVGDLQKIEQHIRAEFESRPKVEGQVCRSCSGLGGICGYDLLSDRTTCYCKSASNGFEVCSSNTTIQEYHSSRSGKSALLKKILIIQVAFASGCIMMIISIVIFIYYTRKSISKQYDVEEIIKRYSTQTPERYSYSKLKKVTNSFKNKLGQGGFSTVYKGKLPSGRDVAVKLLNDQSKENGQDFMNEVVSITKTSHVNIVTLLGFCYEQNKRALIYEYMSKGSLDKYISQKVESSQENEIKLDLNTLYNIVIGIARGLEYLHCGCNTRILHFDIKPHNILLDNDFCPKISDFGLAKQCRARESHVSMTGMKGTIGFMVPEIMFRSFGKVSHKSDVYSFGMLALTMVGERKNSKEGEVEQSSEDCFPIWIYNDLTQSEIWGHREEEEEMAIRKMIIVGLHCIQTLPDDRPSMTRVVAMLEGSIDGLQIPPKPTLFGRSAVLDKHEVSS